MAATSVLPRPKAYDDTFWKPISLWLTTTDHKLIGIMYMVTGILSFLIGGILVLIVRLQLSQPNLKLVDAETYNQLISAHGVTMIFFFVTIDRKSTRLNSSHANISYAVFCLKKKKKTKVTNNRERQ